MADRWQWIMMTLVVSLMTGSAQLILSGGCPGVAVQQDFNVEEYMGTWYQVAATSSAQLFQGAGRCVTAEYSLNKTTGVVHVYNRQVPVRGSGQTSIRGTAVLQDPAKKEAKLIVTFPIKVFKVKAPYWVLDTDYRTCALVYSCVDFRLAHIQTCWLLCRNRSLDDATKQTVDEQISPILSQLNLTRDMLIDTDQTSCEDEATTE